jgi:hypothetical protein
MTFFYKKSKKRAFHYSHGTNWLVLVKSDKDFKLRTSVSSQHIPERIDFRWRNSLVASFVLLPGDEKMFHTPLRKPVAIDFSLSLLVRILWRWERKPGALSAPLEQLYLVK